MAELLELAEEVPLGDLFPSLRRLAVQAGGTHFSRGEGAKIFSGPGGLFLGPMICLEGLYARYVREIVKAGAQILFNATNDAWFGPGMEPALHLYLTTFRSIETRRPLVRSTNTGHSTVVDIDGSLRMKTDLFVENALVEKVPVYRELTTPYLVLGDTLIYLAGFYALWPFGIFLWRRRKRQYT